MTELKMEYPEKTDYSTPAEHWHTEYTHGPDLPTKLIITDVDGVLVDWIATFEPWAVAKLGRHPGPPLDWHQDLRYWLCPDDPVRGQELIEEFQLSDAAGRLAVYPDALEYLPKIHAMGYYFVAISSAGCHPDIVKRRVECVTRHFGTEMFRAFHITAPLTSKVRVLQTYPSCCFIDDMEKQTGPALAVGHCAYTLKRDRAEFDALLERYLADTDGAVAPPISSWRDFYDELQVRMAPPSDPNDPVVEHLPVRKVLRYGPVGSLAERRTRLEHDGDDGTWGFSSGKKPVTDFPTDETERTESAIREEVLERGDSFDRGSLLERPYRRDDEEPIDFEADEIAAIPVVNDLKE